MNVNICIGSTVYGKSGQPLIVDLIDGDILHIGDRKIHRSAIVRWELPASKSKHRKLVLGDEVRYIGTHPSFKKQYGGLLTIWELGKGCDLDKCACLTAEGKVSTWIGYSNLQLVEVRQ